MEPTSTAHEGLKIIGIATRTSNADEADPARATIPRLWKRFFEEWIEELIPNRTSPGTPVAAYTDYESDNWGRYSLVVGAEVTSLQEVPEGMTGLAVPPSEYLVFTGTGPLPYVVIETWREIWRYFAGSPSAERAYTTDFELYRRDATTGQPRVDIHVAVRAPETGARRQR